MNRSHHLINETKPLHLTCPSESSAKDVVLLAHGEGGRLMRKLIRDRIVPILGTSMIEDAARIPKDDGELAITTDSYVVSPLFFREAISVRWRSMAQLTTWRLPG